MWLALSERLENQKMKAVERNIKVSIVVHAIKSPSESEIRQPES